MTKKWRIFGKDMHRQALSFEESFYWNWSTDYDLRILSCDCSDRTGSNEYVDLTITRNTAEECDRELYGQLSDGIFENTSYGVVMEL